MKLSISDDVLTRLLLLVIASCLCWLCVENTTLFQTPYAHAKSPPSDGGKKRIIEAEEFRITDGNGRVRAILTLHPGKKSNPNYEDKPGLYLYHPDGRVAAVFILGDDRGYLSLNDQGGSPRVELGVSKRQSNSHQGGFVNVSDTDALGATLGTWMDWEKGMGPASSLKFYSGMGRKITWEAK
jgi:hypothetical protein